MAEKNIVRRDVVQIQFDVENEPLARLTKEVNKIKSVISEAFGIDDIEDFTKETKKTADGLKDIGKSSDKAKDSLDDVKDGLKDVNKTKLNDVKNGLEKIKGKLTDIGKKAATTAYNGLKKVAGISFKALTVGIAAAAGAVGTLVTKSVQAYAEYEQLVGGVDTLFKGSSGIVQKNAANAFSTAGISANRYMETVTSFSAALINSVGGDTKKAAEMSDMALIDMSDNANKMGTDMESIIGTYQSISRGNFAMLDNLKLGYGGTKSELERLIKDAAKLDKTVKAGDTSFGNVVKAIHAIQEEMGITGTTAKEASTTISGSLGSMKAAWQNTLVSLIRGGDNFDECLDNLIKSAETFGDNIIPAILKALEGVGRLVESLAPKIAEKFPELAKKLLPPLIKAAIELAKGFIKALPQIIATVFKSVFDICGEHVPILKKIGEAFENGGKGIKSFTTALSGVVVAFLAFKKIRGIASGISDVFSIFGKKSGKGLGDGLGKKKGKKSGLIGVLTELSKLKSSTILKAMGNLALIIGGLTLIATIIMAVAPSIASLTDAKSLVELVSTISAIGVVGAGLAKLAGIVGAIPVPTVALGLANIAIMIGGMTAIVAAFGALQMIPGFNDFIDKGGTAIANVFKQIGKIGGAIIGGFGEGLTNSMPKIGKNLSEFAKAIEPMFKVFKGVDAKGVGSFFSSFGGFLIKIAAANFLSIFTGRLSFATLGDELATFALESKPFFNTVAALPQKGFDNAKLLFESLADIGNIPNTGGIVEWFVGTNDYGALAEGLQTLSSAEMVKSFKTFASVDTKGFDNIKLLMESISDIGNVPNTGGIAQWFTGTNDYADLAKGLCELSTEEMLTAFSAFASIDTVGFDNLKLFLEAISDIGNVPNTGGIGQWFSGTNDYGALAKGLEKLSSEKVLKFFSAISEVPSDAFVAMGAMFKAFGSLPKSGGLGSFFSGDTDYSSVAKGFEALGTDKVLNFFSAIKDIDQTGLDKSKPFFVAIGEVIKIAQAGAKMNLLKQFFGDIDNYEWLTKGFEALSDDNVKGFFATIADTDQAGLDKGKPFFAAIAEVVKIAQTGAKMNVLKKFFGDIDDYTWLSKGFEALSNEKVKNFFATIKDTDQEGLDKSKPFFTAIAEAVKIAQVGVKMNALKDFFGDITDYTWLHKGLEALSSEKVKSFFNTIKDTDQAGLDKAKPFFSALAEAVKIAETGVKMNALQEFFGDVHDYEWLHKGLTALGSEDVQNFFSTITDTDQEGLNKAKPFFAALAEAVKIAEVGVGMNGFKAFFGDITDYTWLHNGLKALGSEETKKFFTNIKNTNQEGLDKAKPFFEAIAQVIKIAETGINMNGLKRFFGNNADYTWLYNGLTALSSQEVKSFFTRTAGFSADGIDKAKTVFTFFGELNADSLATKGGQILKFAQALRLACVQFMDSPDEGLAKVDTIVEKLEKLKSLNGITIDSSIFDGFTKAIEECSSNVDKFVKKIEEVPKLMGEALKKSGESLSTALVDIWVDAVKAVTDPVNKLISGANWVLKEFGAKKTLPKWEPYAKGTDGHKGGNALVNDGRGAELVQMPNGRTFIPRGRNVFLPNAPKGMKVLPAEQTARVMGKKSPTFRYAEGTGKLDVWSYFDNAQGLVDKIGETFVNYNGMAGMSLDIGKAMVGTITSQMASWVEKVFDEYGAKSLESYIPSQGVSQWKSTVATALKMEGLYSAANVARTLFQMQTESGGNPRAINLWDSNAKKGIPSKGLMQVIDPTFSAYARPGFNKNIYDPLSNILASVRYATSRYGSLEKAYRGVGYANGTGDFATVSAYTPESSAVVSNNRTTVSETNSYAPVFNLTISGSDSDRDLERKVKRYISEAMQEVFDSMARKRPRLREV